MDDPAHPHTVNTTGQSGQPLNPCYNDQAKMWLYGEFKDNTMNEIEMMNKNYNLLILTP